MRKLCLDIGSVRIGIAQSDSLGIIATACSTLVRSKSSMQDAKKIAEMIKEKQVDTVVVGLPLKLDGSEGDSVKMIRAFVQELSKHTNATIVYEDERFSTVSAQRILIESNVRREKRKDIVDSVAATIILQSYLDRIKK